MYDDIIKKIKLSISELNELDEEDINKVNKLVTTMNNQLTDAER